ncbi:uncharacterized protein LOC114364130 [Ostrinia furnacalis]|uniref:uncharacterized protein LOC114364130 n=1 Tax=Ostrinia furnacalis TaxID=93504 RepID=UPI00103F5560|nr:uncharacterized protein LOC114364130 [Ostrinia furnacalis]
MEVNNDIPAYRSDSDESVEETVLKKKRGCHSLQPSVLICDAAKAIQNAFTNVFGSETIIRMCWAHAKKNIKTKLEQTVDKKKQNDILEDIECLQAATSSQDFDIASELFIKKWENERVFIAYFKEEWLLKNRHWYLGASPGSPATNNALEATNKVIKDTHTLRERIPLSRFLIVATTIVTEWSQNKGIDSFATSYSVKLPDWTQAYQWVKMDIKVTILQSDTDTKTYLIQSTNKNTQKHKYAFIERTWKTFDQYKQIYFSHWKLIMPKNSNMWADSKCSCPKFAKKYMCKHVIGLAIRLKFVTVPLEAKNIQIGQKRKRGRPTKAKRALIIQ